MEGDRVSDGNVSSLNGIGLEQVGFDETGYENLGDELLGNVESYLDDINDRLMISRMVSDSIIKGMVNAVEQEAAEKIAAKELEVAKFKEFLKFHDVGFDDVESFLSPLMENEQERIEFGRNMTFEESCSEHDKTRGSLAGLRNVVREQFKKLKKGIDGIRGSSSIKRTSSGSELVGLGGILREKESESWVIVDRTLDSLKMTLENIYYRVDGMLSLSKSTLCEWHWERDLHEELGAMVMQTTIQTILEECEQKLSETASLSDSPSVDWSKKFSQISNIRMELDAILKSLSHSETGQLTSHGSHDADNFHRTALSNHITSSTYLWDGNGILEGSRTDVPENFEAAQLKHLSKEELVTYFNTVITKMKRDHESTVQGLTEDFFSLKREYLNERGSSLPHKKDKEFCVLRKKIPEIIQKLDKILEENEKSPASTSNAESFCSLKDRLDILLYENHQLRDSLRDKKNELKFLSSQVADAAQKMLQHSIVEANMLKMIGNRNSALEDAHIEAALSEDVCKSVISKTIQELKSDTEETNLGFLIMLQIFYALLSGAVSDADGESTPRSGIENSDIESLITQGICEVIFRETLKDSGEGLKELYGKYLIESQNRTSLEMKALEKENKSRLEAEHKEKLKQEIVVLTKSLEEKEKFVMDISTKLAKARDQFELATQAMDSLIEDANQQKLLASKSSKDLEIVKGQLAEALSQIEADELEIQKLEKKLEQAFQNLEDVNEQTRMALVLSKEKQSSFLLVESKEKELRKQMEEVMLDVQLLSKKLDDFECKVSGKIKANSLRFEDSFSKLSSLLKKAKLLKRTGRIYQQKLERRCADLQMAEAEVDLLGDEIDKLLNLLEKIYITLDHYSPVLQHYPGIIEILKLIRRELSGESLKPTQFSPC